MSISINKPWQQGQNYVELITVAATEFSLTERTESEEEIEITYSWRAVGSSDLAPDWLKEFDISYYKEDWHEPDTDPDGNPTEILTILVRKCVEHSDEDMFGENREDHIASIHLYCNHSWCRVEVVLWGDDPPDEDDDDSDLAYGSAAWSELRYV